MTAGLVFRILREKRVATLLLLVALVANIAVSAVLIYPMYLKAQAGAQTLETATQALRLAERDFSAANALVAGKTKATDDLRRFYAKVLPTDLSGARRATYLKLTELARSAQLQTQRRVEDVQEPKRQEKDGTTLTRFSITMVLKGDYESVRQFLRDVEAADAFVVIDNVALSEGNEPNSALVLTIEMSTYYRAVTRGA